MFDYRDPGYLDNCFFPVSSIFYDRWREVSDTRLAGLERISTPHHRAALVQFFINETPDLVERTGLRRVNTAGHHDVTEGKNPIGDLFFGDLIAGLVPMTDGLRVLDFGCSTGRVIRNLKAAYPGIEAFGCDPRATSIAFNQANLPGISWFVSNEAPPIVGEEMDLSLDLIFAISIWSHFSESRALAWFEEARRITRDGAHLLFTTHGFRSVFHFTEVLRKMPRPKAEERLACLRDGGYHFSPLASSDELDAAHWGNAFIAREWLERELAGMWEIVGHYPGVALANQDAYLMRRV